MSMRVEQKSLPVLVSISWVMRAQADFPSGQNQMKGTCETFIAFIDKFKNCS